MTGTYVEKQLDIPPHHLGITGEAFGGTIYIVVGGAAGVYSKYGFACSFKVPSDFVWLEDILLVTSASKNGTLVLKHNLSKLLKIGEMNPYHTFSTSYMSYSCYSDRLTYLNFTPTPFANEISANDYIQLFIKRDIDNPSDTFGETDVVVVGFIMRYVGYSYR